MCVGGAPGSGYKDQYPDMELDSHEVNVGILLESMSMQFGTDNVRAFCKDFCDRWDSTRSDKTTKWSMRPRDAEHACMRSALEAFAEMGRGIPENWPDDAIVRILDDSKGGMYFSYCPANEESGRYATVGDYRRAHAAFGGDHLNKPFDPERAAVLEEVFIVCRHRKDRSQPTVAESLGVLPDCSLVFHSSQEAWQKMQAMEISKDTHGVYRAFITVTEPR
jgi:hypothetical protein